jgi:hypothetical protein
MKDVIVVRHPEFGRLARQLYLASERFNQAAREKHESLVFIGNLLTITARDRYALVEQIEAEHEAYEAIRDLHEKILALLREKPQARAAATNQR